MNISKFIGELAKSCEVKMRPIHEREIRRRAALIARLMCGGEVRIKVNSPVQQWMVPYKNKSQ